MENTYGFIELWLADIFEFNDAIHYPLESGEVIVAISHHQFMVVKNTFDLLWDGDNDLLEYKPAEAPTIIHGMNIVLHKYWVNDDILNEITGAEVKRTPLYISIFALGQSGSRFNFETTKEKLKNIRGTGLDTSTPTAEVDEQAVEADTTEVVEEKGGDQPQEPPMSEEQKEINTFFTILKSDIRWNDCIETLLDNNLRVLVTGLSPEEDLQIGKLSIKHYNTICKMTKKINKNIIIVRNSDAIRFIMKNLNEKYSLSKISTHTLFFVVDAHNNCDFTGSDNINVLCFGHTLKSLYTVSGKGSLNEELATIRHNEEMNEAKKRQAIKNILKNRKNSPFYKYDAVYKDTVTNVIWGLKDRSIVYFLIPYTDQYHNFYDLVFNEFSRRYNHALPYADMQKIDQNYMDAMHKNNQDDYVNFAISSSQEIIEALKQKRDEHFAKYKEHFEKAMEHSKLYDKFRVQIDYFNETKFREDEKNKALNNYNETMAIDKVSAIIVEDNIVNIYTNNLYAQDERTKRWHDVGTFHISLGMHSNTYSTDKSLRIKNTKYQIKAYQDRMQAPHVYESGTLCHGNLASGLIDAYKRRNLFELVYQIIIFLQSANTSDSAGQHIDKWPEVPEKIALNKQHDEQFDYEILSQITETEKKFDKQLQDIIPINI